MKFIVPRLKLGDAVSGRVEEILPDTHLLINIDGDLLRVSNQTPRPFKVGDPVTLVVKAIAPLRFQLVDERAVQRRKGRLDVSI